MNDKASLNHIWQKYYLKIFVKFSRQQCCPLLFKRRLNLLINCDVVLYNWNFLDLWPLMTNRHFKRIAGIIVDRRIRKKLFVVDKLDAVNSAVKIDNPVDLALISIIDAVQNRIEFIVVQKIERNAIKLHTDDISNSQSPENLRTLSKILNTIDISICTQSINYGTIR